MHNTDASAKKIITLAYLHRYGWSGAILASIFLPPLAVIILLTACFLGYAIWSLAGYRRKWKHIYCSFQNTTHQKMTPHSIQWENIKKTDAYGVPIFYLIMALVCLCIGFFG